MKGLDLHVRRHSPPKYAYPNPPHSSIIALLLFTELRYESFTPNYISRALLPVTTTPQTDTNGTNGKRPSLTSTLSALNFSEPTNLLLHSLLFLSLQTLFLQTNPTIIATQILLAIYILWTTLQLALRYPSSPPLFGPIYKANSLGTFWSNIWHGAFTSPCRSLAYDPVCESLRRNFGVPVQLARGAGVIASFFLMAMFHVYGLWPLLSGPALLRIGAFFVLNGVGTVVEEAIWGRRTHWVKTVLAWTYELAVASWTAEGLDIPEGLAGVDLTALC
ncbi:hypothetical protein FQN54_003119 [Arachnomyces sp. PD_36]|nr:hypothetical protein FQN54_003119 [Arachnomyces sp. PD_36]